MLLQICDIKIWKALHWKSDKKFELQNSHIIMKSHTIL